MFCGTADNKRQDQIPEDSKKIENYFYGLSDKVGQGNFSQVFKGVDQNTGMNVAVKVVKLNSLTTKIAQQLLKNEVSILKQLNHDNVIRCLDVFQSKNNCYIVTQYYGGGDLQKMIFNNKYFHEKDIARIVYELYKGLLYLNQRNIIHRDFKPANIFMADSGIPKIADFGFAVKYNKPFKDISIGSPIYMSPEGLLLHQYGPKTDVWAFGVTMYEMLHGQTPLSRCRDQKQLKQKVLLPPVFREGISPELKRLIDLCLTVDPKHRIEMKDVANTPYMKRLIQQYQKSSKDLTCTNHTNSSLTKNALQFVRQVKTYDQGLALLQYCRLLHKTCQETPSLVFSQWLLNLCWNLTSIKIQGGDKESNQVLMTTIHNYFVKYQKQHTDSRIDVACQEVIGECRKLLSKLQASINNSVLRNKQNNLMMLLRETEMLQKFGETNKLYAYSKATQVQKYLDSLKSAKNQPTANMNSTQLNQFIFNK